MPNAEKCQKTDIKRNLTNKVSLNDGERCAALDAPTTAHADPGPDHHGALVLLRVADHVPPEPSYEDDAAP